jgi:uncharacterized protein (TIGR03083 family)
VEYEAHIAAVERETAALASALAAAPADAPVPTCPGWVVLDLARHVGEFTALWAHVLCEGTGRPKPPYADPVGLGGPGAAALGDWYAEVARGLVAELRATPPATEVWTWVESDKTARFIARRCANELSIHRVDAQSASGSVRPIDPDVAADAIDEVFVMLTAWEHPPDASGLTLHLHPTDRAGGTDEWTIAMGPDGPAVERVHRPADLTLSGAVSDLALLVFGRPGLGPVSRDGDPAALDAWYREFQF